MPEKRFSHTRQRCQEVCRRADSAAPSLALSMAALYAPRGIVSKDIFDTVALLWENDVVDITEAQMKDIVIFDGKGYWCGRRRQGSRVLEFWSTKKKDAARFHFPEVAQKIASTIPQRVTFAAA